jgi:hypothetical protein
MKISVNDVEIFTLSETQKKVIQNDICCNAFEEEMKRRLQYILIDEKYRKCFERLKAEWDKKLADRGVEFIPTNPDAYAELVFSQPDYKNRSARDKESK